MYGAPDHIWMERSIKDWYNNNNNSYETDTHDLARRERWTLFSVSATDRWLNHTSLR